MEQELIADKTLKTKAFRATFIVGMAALAFGAGLVFGLHTTPSGPPTANLGTTEACYIDDTCFDDSEWSAHDLKETCCKGQNYFKTNTAKYAEKSCEALGFEYKRGTAPRYAENNYAADMCSYMGQTPKSGRACNGIDYFLSCNQFLTEWVKDKSQLQYGSYGDRCAKQCERGHNGDLSHYRCDSAKGSWDYCVVNGQTSEGKWCYSDCNRYGHDYDWCWTLPDKEEWDYCVKGDTCDDQDLSCMGPKCPEGYKAQIGVPRRAMFCEDSKGKHDRDLGTQCILPLEEAYKLCDAERDCDGVSESYTYSWQEEYPGMAIVLSYSEPSRRKPTVERQHEWKTCMKK